MKGEVGGVESRSLRSERTSCASSHCIWQLRASAERGEQRLPEWGASEEGSGWSSEEGTGCLRGGLVNGLTKTDEAIACLARVSSGKIACLVRVSSGKLTGKQPRGWATLMASEGSCATGRAGEEVAVAAAAVAVSAAGSAADVEAALGGSLLSGATLAAPIAVAQSRMRAETVD